MYQAEIRQIAQANIQEIRGDLDRAKRTLRQTQIEADRLERTVASLEALLQLGSGHRAGGHDKDMRGSRGDEPHNLTLHEAMVVVLESTPGRMLRAGDLAAEANRRGLYRMRDGRPVEAQQIHARVGHYPNLFAKQGTFITLADEAE